MTGLIVFKGRIEKIIKDKGFKASEKFYDALDEAAKELLERAIRRAEAEGRRVLLDRHI